MFPCPWSSLYCHDPLQDLYLLAADRMTLPQDYSIVQQDMLKTELQRMGMEVVMV
jgi:hypothetical protein